MSSLARSALSVPPIPTTTITLGVMLAMVTARPQQLHPAQTATETKGLGIVTGEAWSKDSVPLAPPHGAPQACGYQGCAGFCSGACPFRPNISSAGTDDLTVYRMTPYNVSGVVQHNTADARGDLGFLLTMYMNGVRCQPPFVTQRCFLADRTIVGAFNVTFDGAYGPYLKCNPSRINGSHFVNTSEFFCGYGDSGNNKSWVPHPAGSGCPPPCGRVNVTVGKDPAMLNFWFPKWRLLHAFGGYWSVPPSVQRIEFH
eukprot:m.317840 g.317840  ORF g.317840 m.317840 type:complete len:257 (+) comp27561_c0_seq13:227-997(+)